MIQTINNGYVESSIAVAWFRDVNRCMYFSELLAKQSRFNEYLPINAQSRFNEYLPINAYCQPQWVDPENTVIFE